MKYQKCNHDKVQIVKQITRNKSEQIYFMCIDCGANSSGAFLKKIELTIYGLSNIDLPIIDDFSNEDKCSYFQCDNTDTEYHHIAPKYLFSDADLWPMVLLCTQHHKEWHERMTPNMSDQKRLLTNFCPLCQAKINYSHVMNLSDDKILERVSNQTWEVVCQSGAWLHVRSSKDNNAHLIFRTNMTMPPMPHEWHYVDNQNVIKRDVHK